MGKFCTNCGRPLEEGRCPACDQPAANTQQAAAEGGTPVFGSLISGFQSLIKSKDLFRILPSAGFALMTVSSLVNLIFALIAKSPFQLYTVLSWLSILSCAAAACGMVRTWHATDSAGFLETGALGLLGLDAILELFGRLTGTFMSYNFIAPALLLLLFALFRTEGDRFWRRLYLIALCVLGAVLFLSVFQFTPTWIVVLGYLFAKLCMTASYARRSI